VGMDTRDRSKDILHLVFFPISSQKNRGWNATYSSRDQFACRCNPRTWHLRPERHMRCIPRSIFRRSHVWHNMYWGIRGRCRIFHCIRCMDTSTHTESGMRRKDRRCNHPLKRWGTDKKHKWMSSLPCT
jgi:hypothetical protein